MADTPNESDGTSVILESAELTVDENTSEYTLYIGVHRLRAVVGILVMVIVVIGAMLPFAGDGVRFETFQDRDLDAEKQKNILDKYNSISGGLTVLLSKPIDVFLSMVVSVTVLCIATKCSVHHENQRRYLAMGVIGVVGYLMNTGFSALNVQVVSGGVHPRIIPSDLAVESGLVDSTQQLDGQGLLSTTWSKNFRENIPGNSVHNTILRTLFAETEDVPTWCNRSDDYPNPFKTVMATYGFPSRSWQQYALSKALEPTATLKMPMNLDSGPPLDPNLPMNESIAINLAVYAMLVSNSFFGWWGGEDQTWDRSNHITVQSLAMADYFNLTKRSSSNATVASDIYGRIVEYFSKADNKSVTDELANIEFSHVDITETISFDALTIEIPTLKYGEQTDNSSSLNPFYRSLVSFLCNAVACLLPDTEVYTAFRTETTTIYPRVQALAICINDEGGEELVAVFEYHEANQLYQSCDQRSNTSMIIISVGKRIEGDSLEAGSRDHDAAQAVNARMVYSLTVGRLVWTLENLNDTYGAECASETGCRGIRFELESGDDVLVGEHAIPMRSLSPINLNTNWFSVEGSQWKILAGTVEETPGAGMITETRPALIVFPRNFKRADNSIAQHMKESGHGYCEIFIDKHINHIEKNHLYIEHTLQPAYTAGLYFIFQNAVVTKHMPSNTSVFSTKSTRAFRGNIQEMNIQASIPTSNLLLSIGGCIAVLVGGAIIAILGKRGEKTLLEQGTAATAAEAISNPDKFPPFLLRMRLRDRTDEQTETLMDSLQVKHVVLENDSKTFIVGGESSCTASHHESTKSM
ncbi:hypothetical protein DVH05_015998 [Phytophthora capsici]|nr:hypothetical protein DVH05_015998 [Phytophthora capsici]